jgi:hypothetical protein
MDAKRIEKWIWPLIYGGLLSLSLGLFVLRSSDGIVMGWALVVAGVAAVLAGLALVVARSRMPDKPESPPEL